MSADFNAGSIEGTLDLDTRPFAAGLLWAKQKAAEFGRSKATAKAELDTGEFTAKKDRVNADLDKIDHKKATAKANLDISEAVAKAEILNKTLNSVLDAGGLGKKATGPGLMVGKLTAMVGGLMSVAAAAGPASVALGGFGVAAATAFSGAMVSMMLFSKLAASDMATIQKAVKAHKQLAGGAGAAEIAYKRLTAAMAAFQQKAGGGAYKVLDVAFNGLAGLLPKLVPLLRTVSNGLTDVLQVVFSLTHTALFDKFLKSLQRFMGGFLNHLGPLLYNALSTYMHLFIAVQPLIHELGQGLMRASAYVATFAAGGGFRKFVHLVQADIPPVLTLLSDLVRGLMHIGQGIAPLSGPALRFIDGLVKAIGSLNLKPFAKGFGDVLNALSPILPVAAQLINVVLKPLGTLLSSLASGPLAQITHSLSAQLQPSFKALGGILGALVKPLSQFLGSIANLANPTGLHLVATLLKSLEGVVKIVAPAFGRLAVALEGVIDQGIEALIPLIPKLTPLLTSLAKTAAHVADALAKIISHKDVALTLLGIVGAIKGIRLAVAGVKGVYSVWTTVTDGVKKFRDMCILTRTELGLLWAKEKIQAGATALWSGITKAVQAYKDMAVLTRIELGLLWAKEKIQAGATAIWAGITGAMTAMRDMAILTRIQLGLVWLQEKAVALWGGIVRGATMAWTAAQWLLNAALDANPIGLVVLAIAALAAGIIYAYKHSETFRNIVNGAFHAVATAASWMWDHVIRPIIKLWVDEWLFLVGVILNGAAKAFGWVPGLGPKLKDAAKWFNNFRDNVNASLSGIKDKTVHVGIAVAGAQGGHYTNSYHPKGAGGGGKFAGGGEVHGPGTATSDSVPIMASTGEFVVRASQAQKHKRLLHAINKGVQGFANGGEVGGGTGPGLHVAVTGTTEALTKLHGIVGQIKTTVNGMAANLVPKFPSVALGGAGVQRWAPLILKALAMLGQPASLLGAVEHRMTQESGGNPRAINLWDSNAAAGHPSKGLMQTIDGTFNAYAGPFRGLGIWNPMANIYAGLNYALHRYGNLYAAMMQPGGYARGTLSASAGWHWVGEHGPELLRFKGGEQVKSHRDSVAAVDNSTVVAALQRLEALLKAILEKPGSVDLSPESRRALIQTARAI